jgi:hypothetical protein
MVCHNASCTTTGTVTESLSPVQGYTLIKYFEKNASNSSNNGELFGIYYRKDITQALQSPPSKLNGRKDI